MTLEDRMTCLGARLGHLNERFGLPQYQHTVVLEAIAGGEQWLVDPNPQVANLQGSSFAWAVNVRPGDFLSEAVQIMGDELVVTGIPRSHGDNRGYSLETLEASRVLIGPTWDGNRYVGGMVYTLVYIAPPQLTTWGLLLALYRPQLE